MSVWPCLTRLARCPSSTLGADLGVFACLVAVHGNRAEWKDPGNSWLGQNWERGGHPDAVLWDEGERSVGPFDVGPPVAIWEEAALLERS